MTKITADDILALKPCWIGADIRIRALVGKGVTYAQIAEDKRVPLEDRGWVLTHLAARTPEGHKAMVLWAAGCMQDDRLLITDENARDDADMCVAMAVAFVEGCATADDCRDAAYAAYAASIVSPHITPAAASVAYAAYDRYDGGNYCYTAQQFRDLAAVLESL